MSNTDLMLLVDPQREEREAKLKAYNAYDHIKKWPAFNKSTGLTETIEYYPAAWRLYELSLKFPTANFSIDIIHMDAAKDLVVLKARLFFGELYEKSPKRAEALKQGRLSNIDKVETAAKARAARDFGIGTEHALDMDDASVEGTIVGGSLVVDNHGATVNLANSQQIKNIQQLCKALERECPNLEGVTAVDATVMIQGLSAEAKERSAAQRPQKRESKESYLKKLTTEPTVGDVRKRVAEVHVVKNGKALTFEQFLEGVCGVKWESDDAVTPDHCKEMNRRLDAILQARENARAAKEKEQAEQQMPKAS